MKKGMSDPLLKDGGVSSLTCSNRSASALESVLFPAPAGPMISMIILKLFLKVKIEGHKMK
jgi:hypothetical protein